MAGWNGTLDDWQEYQDSFRLQAGLSFAIDAWIPGSRKDLAWRQLHESGQSLRQNYQTALTASRDEIHSLWLDLSLQADSLTLSNRQLDLAERIYQRTVQNYQQGNASLLDLESAQLDWSAAQQSRLSAQYQYLALLIDLGYALQLDWREWLGALNP
ncbi:MAG: hypothetical protein A2087_11110 [Spirochaetes bacterium GWD1_61_31]|nr:MAG: hypothetical protein A2Y37_09940 [Spirochaetes bacterium GWB1_60_80]OHD34358.1 MAG: hypothetical protein A2004_07855 [Spirochaetes bacterium GWC1_61_12]OHD43125.1 MAG: hypothetical protein A2087_11110 [Spirochaetes bacterium GWD1_61_31]OHD44259.1 MAG: hypothetical protein A2Y35_06905 [Spirochaetes bacterium GWE1_60_18]OHD60381.1 MAG: hypothetical protein A2Y32_00620 [Spirochaetes bacterium GWF1_60_12]HAX38524.1 hypothetical protein [Spirochaetaceae bacterium]